MNNLSIEFLKNEKGNISFIIKFDNRTIHDTCEEKFLNDIVEVVEQHTILSIKK